MINILPVVSAAIGASKPLKELAPQVAQNTTRAFSNPASQTAFANRINQEVRNVQTLGFG